MHYFFCTSTMKGKALTFFNCRIVLVLSSIFLVMEVEVRVKRKSKKYFYSSKCVLSRHTAQDTAHLPLFERASSAHNICTKKLQLFLQTSQLHPLPKEQPPIHHCTTRSQCIHGNGFICNSFSHHGFCKLISLTAHSTFKLPICPPKQANSLPDLCPANKPTLLSSATGGIKEKTQRSETYLN